MRSYILAVGAVLFLTACAGPHTQPQILPASNASAIAHPNGSSSIQHVIVMVQGHRGFDNLFAGFPGAASSKVGIVHTGRRVPLRPMTMTKHPSSLASLGAFQIAYNNGKLDGFDLVYPSQALFPYHFVEHSEISAYWSLAKHFAVADHMFSTSISNSAFVAQLYLLAARSQVKPGEYIADHPSQEPWGCDAPPGTTTPVYSRQGIKVDGPYPCFSWGSLPQLLDAARVTWRYYLPTNGRDTNAIDSIRYVRITKDWRRDVTMPQTTILSDISQGTLPQVAWVFADVLDSDNPGTGSGSRWVSRVVGALRNSPYWQHSAVIIVWEASDFFYDEVPPPRLDPVELGFRVPLIVVSPYAKPGYVSHTQYEFGSILRFIEETFALPSLGETDARANSLSDMFTF